MSLRRTAEHAGETGIQPLGNLPHSPYLYNEADHLSPERYSDHDGGPWSGPMPDFPIEYRKSNAKWVFAPRLGSSAPALSLFPLRYGTNVSFSRDVHINFAAAYTPNIARFTELFCCDVDKKGRIPHMNQNQEWVCTFRGKSNTGSTSIEMKVRLDDAGQVLEGFGVYLPDSNLVMDLSSFAAPPGAHETLHQSSALVVNAALVEFDVERDMKFQFSKLDNSVEREKRVLRAKQAFSLLQKDLKMRSDITVKQINSIRAQAYYKYLANDEKFDPAFFELDVERAPI